MDTPATAETAEMEVITTDDLEMEAIATDDLENPTENGSLTENHPTDPSRPIEGEELLALITANGSRTNPIKERDLALHAGYYSQTEKFGQRVDLPGFRLAVSRASLAKLNIKPPPSRGSSLGGRQPSGEYVVSPKGKVVLPPYVTQMVNAKPGDKFQARGNGKTVYLTLISCGHDEDNELED